MHPFLSRCRIVQLDNPFQSWHDPIVRSLFEKITTLKFQGYGPKYPPGVVPVDTSDWIARHYLLCRNDDGTLEPIMGFRRVTLERCQNHYLPFPPLAACHEAGCPHHIREVETFVASFKERPGQLSYTGSFTIAPYLRKDRQLIENLCQLVVVLHYLFHQEEADRHEIISAPVIRFKMDSLLRRYGFEPLLEPSADNNHGQMAMPHVAGEPIRFMRGRSFSDEIKRLGEKYQPAWANRIRLDATAVSSSNGSLRKLSQALFVAETRTGQGASDVVEAASLHQGLSK